MPVWIRRAAENFLFRLPWRGLVATFALTNLLFLTPSFSRFGVRSLSGRKCLDSASSPVPLAVLRHPQKCRALSRWPSSTACQSLSVSSSEMSLVSAAITFVTLAHWHHLILSLLQGM